MFPMMPDVGAPAPLLTEYAVGVPFDAWSGPSHLVVGVTTDRSAAEAEARRYTDAVLLERADEDDSWTEVPS